MLLTLWHRDSCSRSWEWGARLGPRAGGRKGRAWQGGAVVQWCRAVQHCVQDPSEEEGLDKLPPGKTKAFFIALQPGEELKPSDGRRAGNQIKLTNNLSLQSRGISATPEFPVWDFISFP